MLAMPVASLTVSAVSLLEGQGCPGVGQETAVSRPMKKLSFEAWVADPPTFGSLL